MNIRSFKSVVLFQRFTKKMFHLPCWFYFLTNTGMTQAIILFKIHRVQLWLCGPMKNSLVKLSIKSFTCTKSSIDGKKELYVSVERKL